MRSETNYTPLIIIGAPRSGTNLLRDLLVQLPGLATWPCDEINYIWRHHNARVPHDAFDRNDARPEVCRYIRGQFDKLARKTGCEWVVEKTCASSLRLGFVDQVFPEARYLVIARDGRDVVASAMKRWKADLDWRYIAAKARYVPPSDVPYYACRYLGHRLSRLFSREKRLPTWGPRWRGIEKLPLDTSLAEVCALQWRESIESTWNELESIDPRRVHCVNYEDLVGRAPATMEEVLRFLEIPATAEALDAICAGVFQTSVGNWQSQLTPEEVERVEPILEPSLVRLGYQKPDAPAVRKAA